MKVIEGRNVNVLLPQAIRRLYAAGEHVESRGMPVIEMASPVSSVYQRPRERVLFCATRDANPFFHFMEGLWLIGGREDVEFISKYNSKIHEYSDDGKSFHGAYGYRLRHIFACDQIARAIKRFKREPDTRQVVLQIWSAVFDLNKQSKDIPCNDLIILKIRNGKLNMLIANRSNDIIWGCYGANAVHFSMLQEYMANMIGVPVGTYTQVSDSFHAYTENPQWEKLVKRYVDNWTKEINPYTTEVKPYKHIVTFPENFDQELQDFFKMGGGQMYANSLLEHVAVPMAYAWELYKDGNILSALVQCRNIQAEDWQLACVEWLQRRRK